jgi:hypothetical protein
MKRKAALYYTVRWVLWPAADAPKVKAKNMDLLKSRGHGKLKLDEHESAPSSCFCWLCPTC